MTALDAAVAVVTPYRPDPGLDPLLPSHEARWVRRHRATPIYADAPGPVWSRAAAINQAVSAAADGWDVVVVVDVCIDPDPVQVVAAVGQVRTLEAAGTAAAVVPYEVVIRLNEQGTRRHLERGRENHPLGWGRSTVVDVRQPVGGITVIGRRMWEQTGGMDERFRVWGGEDDAFWATARILGRAARTGGVAWQLWHPPMPRPTGGDQNPNKLLADRYRVAAGLAHDSGDPAPILSILAER